MNRMMVSAEVEYDMAGFINSCLDVLAEGLLAENLSEQEFVRRFELATSMMFSDLHRLSGGKVN